MRKPEIMGNMSPQEAEEKIRAAGLCDCGVFRDPLADRMEKIRDHQKIHPEAVCVTAALNNNDSEHVLLSLLENRRDEIFEGIGIMACALSAQKAILQIPEGEEISPELEGAAAEAGVEIGTGLVNMRQNRHQMVMHIAAALSVSELFHGKVCPGAYVSVCCGAETGPLKKVPYGTTVKEIAGEIPPMRFFSVGEKIYSPDETNLAITEDLCIGNGVIRFYPADCCIIQETESHLLKLREESCGKCTFCREGLTQFHTALQAIPKGKGQRERLDIIREIGEAMPYSTQCSIGMQGADFVLGTMDKFSKEYDDHIIRHRCEAKKCTAFQKMYIDPQKCTGCMDCMDVCGQDAIEGKSGYIHMIDEYECSLCGKCAEVCGEGAVIHTSERLPKLPTKLTKCGRFKKR